MLTASLFVAQVLVIASALSTLSLFGIAIGHMTVARIPSTNQKLAFLEKDSMERAEEILFIATPVLTSAALVALLVFFTQS